MLLYSNYIINGSMQQLPRDEHLKRRTRAGSPFYFRLIPFQYRRLFPAEQFLDGIHAGACNVLVDGAGAGFVVEGTLVGVCVDIPLV